MPGNPHPFQEPYANRSTSELLGATKLHVRQIVADPDEVRNTDYSGQFGGIYVRSIDANFKIDTADLQVDDGTNVIHDAAGNHFVRIAVAVSGTQESVATAGDVVLDGDSADTIIINKAIGEATNVYLPPVADFAGKKIRIVDGRGDAATNNITVLPAGGSGHSVLGGAGYVIDSNYSSIQLEPVSGVGWL